MCGQQALPLSQSDEFPAGPDTRLLQHGGDMVLDGAPGQTELPGNFVVGGAFGEAGENFQLAGCEAQRMLKSGRPGSPRKPAHALGTKLLSLFGRDRAGAEPLKDLEGGKLRRFVAIHERHRLLVRAAARFPLFCGPMPVTGDLQSIGR